MIDRDLAARIDATQLDPLADEATITELCYEAGRLGCATVCVHQRWLPTIRGLAVPCTVISFPHGADLSEAKAAAVVQARAAGAIEIDVVCDLAALRADDMATARRDLEQVVEAAGDRAVKAIIETSALTEPQIIAASVMAAEAGAAYVKTSTGKGSGGATVEDVALIKAALAGTNVKIKASGGIKTRDAALALVEAGADRIGSSTPAALAETE